MDTYANDITQAIGNTPLIKLHTIAASVQATIFGKAEFCNPLGSVKDRIGYAMIKAAEKEGKITKDTDLIYPIHYDSASSDILPKLLGGSAFLFQRITDRCQAFRNKT